jgi:serine/threonine protein kinase
MGFEASGDGAASDATASLPRPGEVIGGKFVVERVLGVGGMGVVVAAHHSHLQQTVAIKFLRRDTARDEAAVHRFLREARAVAALQGDHVVRIMDAGRLEDGLPYLVMEYLNGTDLDQVLAQKGRLSLEECLDYLLQAMEAVAEAHAAGIVHRDLKPSNLFVSMKPDGSRFVKVLDFGISKALDLTGRNEVNLTATSITLGSPLYMSPEQVRSSKSVDARTDIWALGIIAYELLAGVQPFEAETVTGLCAKIVADEPAALRSIRPDLPATFEAVVMRCLEKNVAARYQTVRDLAAALRPFASEDGLISVNKIARIGGSRPTLASAQEGRSSTPPPPAVAPGASNPGVGYAETVPSWQTTGTRRGRRALAATVGSVGGVALLVGAIFAVRWSQRTSPPDAPRSAAAGLAVDVVSLTATSNPVPIAPAAPPSASATELAEPPGAASAPLAPPATAQAASVPAIAAPRRLPAASVADGATLQPKARPARTQDELLLDRR